MEVATGLYGAWASDAVNLRVYMQVCFGMCGLVVAFSNSVVIFLVSFFLGVLAFGLPSWRLQTKIGERLELLRLARVSDLNDDCRNDTKASQFDLLTSASNVREIDDSELTSLVWRLQIYRSCHFGTIIIGVFGQYFFGSSN